MKSLFTMVLLMCSMSMFPSGVSADVTNPEASITMEDVNLEVVGFDIAITYVMERNDLIVFEAKNRTSFVKVRQDVFVYDSKTKYQSNTDHGNWYRSKIKTTLNYKIPLETQSKSDRFARDCLSCA